MHDRETMLSRVPPAQKSANCTQQHWRRRLEGPLPAGNYTISLAAYPHGSGRTAQTASAVQASVMLLVRKAQPAASSTESRRSFPPTAGPSRSEEIVIGHTELTIGPRKTYSAQFQSPGEVGAAGDSLILKIGSSGGTACVATGPTEASFVDLPPVELGENRSDYENRGDDLASTPVAMPAAAGRVRLYPTLGMYRGGALATIPPPNTNTDCTGSSRWTRKLEGPLEGDRFTVSVYTHGYMYDSPPGRMRVTLVHARGIYQNVSLQPTSSQPEIDRFVRERIRPDAPPPPSPKDKQAFLDWAVANRKETGNHLTVPHLVTQQEMTAYWRDMRPYEPSPGDGPKLALGESVVGTTTLNVTSIPQVQSVEFHSAVAAQAGDLLRLETRDLDTTSCVGGDPEGRAFVELPQTQITETKEDAANRVYEVRGVLTSAAGAPLANRLLMFSHAPGVATYAIVMGQPGPISNPRATTDARGGFSFRLAASRFGEAGAGLVGYLQVAEPMGRDYRLIGEPIKVSLPDRKQPRLDLGRVVAKIPPSTAPKKR